MSFSVQIKSNQIGCRYNFPSPALSHFLFSPVHFPFFPPLQLQLQAPSRSDRNPPKLSLAFFLPVSVAPPVSGLESKTLTSDLHTQFSNFLKPITELKRKKPPAGSPSILRLTQIFISFLNKTATLLYSLLRNRKGAANQERERDETLLAIYKLTIDCIGSLSPFIAGEAYKVHSARVSFVSCLETCEKYEQAEYEAALVLKDLISVLAPARTAGSKNSCTDLDAKWKIPDPKAVGRTDSEITRMFRRIIVCFANCAFKTKSKSCEDYKRIVKLVDQVQPWIQILDKKASGENHVYLVNALSGCNSFLLSECTFFGLDLVEHFCSMFLKECSKISIDMLANNAHWICYKIECDSLFLNVIEASLELFLCEYKVETVESLDKFLKFVAYSFRRLCHTDFNNCNSASIIFNRHVDKFDKVSPPLASLLSLYSLLLEFKSKTPYELSSFSNLLLSNFTTTTQELKDIIATVSEMHDMCQFDKATVALEFCFEATLANIKKSYDKKSTVSKDDFTPLTKDIISDAYAILASIINALSKCNAGKSIISSMTVRTLVELSYVEDLHGFQSGCFVLLSKWVKVLCKEHDDGDKSDDSPILYKLLTKYTKSWSKKNLGRILEQELLAYALVERQFPNFCIKMQENVSEVLLNELYSSDNYRVERSRVLVSKARFKRAGGSGGLKDCLKCLSDAISLLEGVMSNASIYHQLATTYCLHAQCIQEAHCIQEAKLDLEVMLKDIESALKCWSGINIEHYSHEGFGSELVAKDVLVMLCSMLDLLSLKGCFKFHYEICKLICEIFKQENLPLDKLFSLLWTNRRLGHSICRSEIDLHNLSQSITEFPVDCLKAENPSLSLFLQSLFSDHLVSQKTEINFFEILFGCKAGLGDLKSIASSLASKADTMSLFFAGYAYYDLSQRLLSEGQLIEALCCARESRKLRTRVLKRRFIYNEKAEELQLEAIGTNTTEIWPDLNRHADLAYSFLSPWIVLRSFLESTFQLGSMCESSGNVYEAEALLKIGKEISRCNSFCSFEIIFASSLGQIYRKRKLLDLAEAELKTAKTVLENTDKRISCHSCAILIKTNINLLEGDLSRTSNLEHALRTYKSALENLDHLELKYPNIESCKISSVLNKQISSVSSLKDKNVTKKRNVLKDMNLEAEPVRMTRSRLAAVLKKGQSENTEMKNEIVVGISSPKRTRKKYGGNGEVVSEKAVCLSCLVRKTVDSRSVKSLLQLGFEFRKRRFVLLLCLKIARLLAAQGGAPHEIHEMFWKCVSILSCKYSEIQGNQLNELLINEDFGKALCIERVLVLYNMGFVLLNRRQLKKSRSKCCSLSNLDTSVAITWLLGAFILSQEFPLLLTKVSRLLACAFMLSELDTSISLPLCSNEKSSFSVNQWASFFHQASIGDSLDIHYLCALNQASKGEDGETVTKTCKTTSKFKKYSFERIEQLEDHVASFFKKLPSIPIICMSMLGDDYANFLGETLILPPFPFPPAWIILSRINSTNQPITMLLPINRITDVYSAQKKERSKESSEIKEGQVKSWICPWDRNVLDEVAHSFKLLMEENYLSMVNQSNQLRRRSEINKYMQRFLEDLEESWFGPWSCLLKGELINKASLSLTKHSLAKAVLCGAKSLDDGKACHSQIVSYGGHLGHGEKDKFKFRVISSSCEFGSELLESLPELTEEREKEKIRDPVIFVLDADIQMLPWENLPSLRDQEVYRMPSVGTIFLTLDQNLSKKRDDFFPKVNLSDAYYLVNPDRNLSHTQGEIEPLCRNPYWRGKVGNKPTSEELCAALKNHDIFLYFGHGSGSQYLSGEQIEKLDNCAAAFLMGCCSGSLNCRGIYAPKGIPLSYLFAGSPAVIGNLWDVTDKDIDRFAVAVLESWLNSCELVEKSRNLSERKGSRIASCMGKARKECWLGLLIGAAPVCYGVPTVLARGL
ncbi:hypothetical protein LUZ60_002072 [Juncus effusus]|nr:hypothetical protein LUZ60_002072 [Juncus effusus]